MDLLTKLSQAIIKPLEIIERDTERDNYMTAEQALKYGLVDKVVTSYNQTIGNY